jgi:hypothetical protein
LGTAFAPVSENPIQRQCADCAKEEEGQATEAGKDLESGVETRHGASLQVMSMSAPPDSSASVQRQLDTNHPHHPHQIWQRAQFIKPVVQKQIDPRVQMGQMVGQVVQFYPGDGMVAPGDCSWTRYSALLVAVESTKKVTAKLGKCLDTDDCVTLATKIAAVTAEIAARTAIATTCFKGGDKKHRDQLDQKRNMMMRCYRYFDDSKCPQQLVQAMEEVVERTRRLVEAGLTIAAIAALIVAIIALGKAILAVGVAGSIAAGILAVIAALELALQQIQQAH